MPAGSSCRRSEALSLILSFTLRQKESMKRRSLGATPRLHAVRKLDKIRFSLDFRRNHLKRRSFLGLRPHILGLISIFNGYAIKNRRKTIKFCRSRGIHPKTPERRGGFGARLLYCHIKKLILSKSQPLNESLFLLFLLAKPIKI